MSKKQHTIKNEVTLSGVGLHTGNEVVMTFKPAVESAWQEDLLSHIDFEGWQFYSRDYAKQMGIDKISSLTGALEV